MLTAGTQTDIDGKHSHQQDRYRNQEGTTTTDETKKKYYAVKKGRCPGIYETWSDCKEQIHGYSGAVFKSFEDRQQAVFFLSAEEQEPPAKDGLPIAYIDGSYSKKNARYGYGGFIIEPNGKRHIIQGHGSKAEYLQERNIAGELIGTLQAVYKAMQLDITEMIIYHDYTGIKNYITGDWKAKTPLAIHYRDMIDLFSSDIVLHFIPVKGHTGIEGNELADLLAKEAAGATLRKKDIALLQNFKQEGTE